MRVVLLLSTLGFVRSEIFSCSSSGYASPQIWDLDPATTVINHINSDFYVLIACGSTSASSLIQAEVNQQNCSSGTIAAQSTIPFVIVSHEEGSTPNQYIQTLSGSSVKSFLDPTIGNISAFTFCDIARFSLQNQYIAMTENPLSLWVVQTFDPTLNKVYHITDANGDPLDSTYTVFGSAISSSTKYIILIKGPTSLFTIVRNDENMKFSNNLVGSFQMYGQQRHDDYLYTTVTDTTTVYFSFL